MKKQLLLFVIFLLFSVSGITAQQIRIVPSPPPEKQSCVDIFNLKQYWGSLDPNTVYTLENAPVVSFVYETSEGLAIYVQDISGGLIILSGPYGPVSPFVAAGDCLEGLTGRLTLINGSLAMIPQIVPTVNQTGLPADPQSIDVSILMLNPVIYESSLVSLQNVVVNGGGTTFQLGQNYIVYQQKATTAIATLFANADYLNTPVPTAPFNLTGLVTYNRFTGEVTITPRSLSDISYDYGNTKVGNWRSEDLFVADGYLHVRSLVRQQIRVYTALGQLVIQEWVDSGNTEIALPVNGIYMVKMGNLVKKVVFP
ncbi:MAG: hypothetical protein RR202_12025 [Bacteroidales bacterium]